MKPIRTQRDRVRVRKQEETCYWEREKERKREENHRMTRIRDLTTVTHLFCVRSLIFYISIFHTLWDNLFWSRNTLTVRKSFLESHNMFAHVCKHLTTYVESVPAWKNIRPEEIDRHIEGELNTEDGFENGFSSKSLGSGFSWWHNWWKLSGRLQHVATVNSSKWDGANELLSSRFNCKTGHINDKVMRHLLPLTYKKEPSKVSLCWDINFEGLTVT